MVRAWTARSILSLSFCFGARLGLLSPRGRIKPLTDIPFLQTKLGAGRLMGPKGVAVDRNGHIIVVDNKSCCVFTFQPNGKLVGRFGGRGATDRHFAGIGKELRDLVSDTPVPENCPGCPSSTDSLLLYFGPRGPRPFSIPEHHHPRDPTPLLTPQLCHPRCSAPSHSGSWLTARGPTLYFQGPILWL